MRGSGGSTVCCVVALCAALAILSSGCTASVMDATACARPDTGVTACPRPDDGAVATTSTIDEGAARELSEAEYADWKVLDSKMVLGDGTEANEEHLALVLQAPDQPRFELMTGVCRVEDGRLLALEDVFARTGEVGHGTKLIPAILAEHPKDKVRVMLQYGCQKGDDNSICEFCMTLEGPDGATREVSEMWRLDHSNGEWRRYSVQ